MQNEQNYKVRMRRSAIICVLAIIVGLAILAHVFLTWNARPSKVLLFLEMIIGISIAGPGIEVLGQSLITKVKKHFSEKLSSSD